ncbi:MAG: phosphodiesterase [bacterium ADurb.Bin363]|nr:MAG: phosphodiesterase [bacterium ADurb.Bin363]
MRYAVMSDIHSNIEALETIIKKIEASNIDRIMCLGDIVGYGANPNECIETIRENSFNIILGNHDRVAINLEAGEDFTTEAKIAIEWTKKRLEPKNKEFLSRLTITQEVGDSIYIVHGSPLDKDEYLSYKYQTKANFEFLENNKPNIKLCFFGHTHSQAIWFKRGDGSIFNPSIKGKAFPVNSDCLYLINPGSVGQARGQGAMACYLVYDSEKKNITFQQIEYDYKSAAKKIIQAGLPPFLGERLEKGI